ncbi:energy-coupled thiamine transporter ThiT [Bacillus carboniphilus]|uniref:Energy-coupled thiamine transporter ThiT n=1 Tax=Bacillus carboniphilus TaxID=86663 RepID=A0ABN0W7U3_9BACI
MGSNSSKTLFLVEVAIFTAIAYLLDYVSGILMKNFWPQGGSVSLAMVPVVIMAFRWGLKGGLATGFLLGSIQLFSGFATIYYFLQIIFDYSLAFAVVGFAGIFAKSVQRALVNGNKGQLLVFAIFGSVLGGLLRYFIHFISGVTFFAQYAPEDQPVWLYSIVYNGGYMIPSIIITAVVVYLLILTAPKQMMRKDFEINKAV